MRFRIASTSSFQPSTRHRRWKVRYYNPPTPKVQPDKDRGIPSVQIIYEPSEVWSDHVIPLVLDKFSVKLVDTTTSPSLQLGYVCARVQTSTTCYIACKESGYWVCKRPTTIRNISQSLVQTQYQNQQDTPAVPLFKQIRGAAHIARPLVIF